MVVMAVGMAIKPGQNHRRIPGPGRSEKKDMKEDEEIQRKERKKRKDGRDELAAK